MSTNEKIKEIHEKLFGGFFGFWVKKWRFTFLVIFMIVVGGLFSLYTIPKESSPDIEYGIVSITTIYQGVNPQDIDSLITEKIETAVKDIEGVKKISSTSAVGFSSTILELENDADSTQALVDIKDAVDKVSLPTDAEDPTVTLESVDNKKMFVVLLYGDEDKFDQLYLYEKATDIKESLNGKGSINSITIAGLKTLVLSMSSINGMDDVYEYKVLFDKNKLEALGLSLFQISQTIQSRNQNQPLGNHDIGDFSYDFRIDSEIQNLAELGKIPIQTSDGIIYLKDIATITKNVKDDAINKLGSYGLTGQNFVSMGFNKKEGANLFASAQEAKELLEQELQKLEYEGLDYKITYDMSEFINEDYQNLAKNGLQTLLLVFLALLFFIGVKESVIATITLPLAFFVTFMILNWLDLSLNFLTNFSLIVTFGIAIDTTIVVIEGAHEKLRAGYKPVHAILLAVRDYKAPLIAGTSTTLVVFLPLLTLPGVMGKFLAYIPITIFATLAAALLISLTLNSALYYKLSKPQKYFDDEVIEKDFMTEEDLILLESDRTGKKPKAERSIDSSTKTGKKIKRFREKILDKVGRRYSSRLEMIMKNRRSRRMAILVSIGLFLANMIIVPPLLGFKLFPSKDNGFITVSMSAQNGTNQDIIYEKTRSIYNILSDYPEIKVYESVVKPNDLFIFIELLSAKYRKKNKYLDAFDLEKVMNQDLDYLRSEGLKIEVTVLEDGPPSGSAVGIKLVADNNDKFEKLLEVAKEFEAYLSTVGGIKNPSISSEDSPGQFVFTRDQAKLSLLGISPSDLNLNLYAVTNGINAGTIKGEYDDHDIKLAYKDFEDEITANDIEAISIMTTAGPVVMGSVSENHIESAIGQIQREDTKIMLTVGAGVEQGVKANEIQSQFLEFAKEYNYPDGISFEAGGEAEDNMELLVAMASAFVIALILIFGILVLQFNSFGQPLTIMFSILMGLFGANIGLLVTGNPYSLMFMIGFIALTGIVINDAIVFLDRANSNVERGMDTLSAIKEAGHARLHPIILTTLTTIVGLTSIVSDAMWQPLAVTIMFGIFFGSAMTLFVVPAFYYTRAEAKARRKQRKLAKMG